ncbi:MAG: hypothetical protein H7Y38_12630 [Armatimonadetes bacterium]|nr:hypothetical protein [Armatimonadota bacterium]
MTKLQIELSDETYEAIRKEADHFEMSVEEYIRRMMVKLHAFRVTYPLKEARAYLDRLWRGDVPGDGIPAIHYFPDLRDK